MKKLVLFSILMLLLFVSCGSDSGSNNSEDGKLQTDDDLYSDQDQIDDEADEDQTGDETDKDPKKEYPFPIKDRDVKWESCAFGAGKGDGECTTADFPLFWGSDSSETIGVFAKRRKAKGDADAQIWFVDGGPGSAGTMHMPYFMDRAQKRYPNADVYTIDHRGTGNSEFLSCSKGDSGSDDCIEELKQTKGERLDGFTTTMSATDLAALIEATREEGKRVFVWGGSYGTYLVQRYLQLFPNQADGVILEGIAPPDGTFITFDEYAEKAGKRLLAMCSDDEFCSSKLTKDPVAFTENMKKKLGQGVCKEHFGNQLSPELLMGVAIRLMYSTQTNVLIPSIFYRVSRCNREDAEAIGNMFDKLFGYGYRYRASNKSMSDVLYNHIVFSEMWNTDSVDMDNLFDYQVKMSNELLFNTGLSILTRHNTYEKWPRYNDEKYDDKWAETSVPMLMLAGGVDPATTLDQALALKDHFTADHQYFLAFPPAAHNVVDGTPMADGRDCASDIMFSFVKNENSDLDLSCMEKVLPLDFRQDGNFAQMIYGTNDLYENDGALSVKRSLPGIEDPELERVLEKVGRELVKQFPEFSGLKIKSSPEKK